MSLNKATLKTALEDWMNGKNDYSTVLLAVTEITDAYDDYAANAVDVSGDNPLSVKKSTMLSTLQTLPVEGTVSGAAQIFENAIIAFWTGATFKLTKPPTGTIAPEVSANVTTPIPAGGLKSGFTSIFGNLDLSVSARAQAIADLLDTETKKNQVTCIGTNAAPPPSNISVIGTIS